MVLLLKVLWTFGFVLRMGSAVDPNFGICENVVTRRITDNTVVPPVHHYINETVTECCQGFMISRGKCIPMCQQSCVNSVCIGNNQCKCHPGFEHHPDNQYRCVATCEPPCGKGGVCFLPNRCACSQGHKMNNGTCGPICSFTEEKFDCINGECVGPNKCECQEGFRFISEFQCEPVCENCVHGECIAPETCECNDGYEKNSDDVCAPICDPPCINGKCEAPNSCTCNENFEKYLKQHECLEKQVIKDLQSCSKSCEHGTCDADGNCVCGSGYEKYNNICSKICDKPCSNGRCLEDTCVCPENFKLSENATACLPICAFEDGHDCIAGVCIAPQVCQCIIGYKFLDSRNCTCVPMCEPMCINGVCTEDGCICHEHFYNISDHECIKNCSEGFTWVYDDCIEDVDLGQEMNLDIDTTTEEGTTEDFGTTRGIDAYDWTTGLFDFDSSSEQVETTTSNVETTENFSERILEDEDNSDDDDDDENDDDDDDENDESSGTDAPDLKKEDSIIVQKSFHQMIPVTTFIILLSTVVILIVAILITFCVLYRRINPKNIYYVNEYEKSSNCVYLAQPSAPVAAVSDEQCSTL